jgi:hypothetical protein
MPLEMIGNQVVQILLLTYDCHLFNIDQVQKSSRRSSLSRTKTINDSISPTKEKREFSLLSFDTGLNKKQLYNEMVGITSKNQNECTI